jgi:hypothetical protein
MIEVEQAAEPDRPKSGLPVSFPLEVKGKPNLNARDIGILSFKVLSIYSLIEGFDKLPSAFHYVQEGDSLSVLLALSAPVSLIIGGMLLWFVARPLASSIFRPEEFENNGQEISTANLQSIAFSIVGIYILSTALSNLFDIAALCYGAVRSPVGVEVPVSKLSVIMLSKTIFGLWLLLGSRGLVNFVRSIKRNNVVTSGRDDKGDSD